MPCPIVRRECYAQYVWFLPSSAGEKVIDGEHCDPWEMYTSNSVTDLPHCIAYLRQDNLLNEISLDNFRTLSFKTRTDRLRECRGEQDQHADASASCEGIIQLTWSFPYSMVRGTTMLRRVFKSDFHITADLATECVLGSRTLQQELAPYLRWGPPNTQGQRQAYLVTCCAKDPAKGSHWHVPNSRHSSGADAGGNSSSESQTDTTMLPEQVGNSAANAAHSMGSNEESRQKSASFLPSKTAKLLSQLKFRREK